MNVHAYVWFATFAGLAVVFAVDLTHAVRHPHEPTSREASLWTAAYVLLAVLFGLGVLLVSGPRYGGEFFAGWLTEYSLSVDNLFVFVIILNRFSVPRAFQQEVLLVGIMVALVLRGAFIAVGSAAITNLSWIFYAFGAFLVYTAVKLVTGGDDEEVRDNLLLRVTKRLLPTTDDYHEAKLTTRVDGRRLVTPMLVVMIAIGTTDVLFALDSIPAIFGLTKESYLVFTANAFALLGLRQLFFLLDGLLDRLVYLSYGLSVILAFIGVKLVLEALHTNQLPFVNDGEHVGWALEIPIWLSLVVILGALAVTAAASLAKTAHDERSASGSR